MPSAVVPLVALILSTAVLTGNTPTRPAGPVAPVSVAPAPVSSGSVVRVPGASVPTTPRAPLLRGEVIQPAPSGAVWPLKPQPAVVRAFEPPLSRYAAGHRGVDLAGAPGQRVFAAEAGRVTYAGLLAGRGVVVVSHGSTRTTYEPVHARVHVGATVRAGDVLGTLERFGSHCAPASCLHWGLIRGDTYLDPLTLLGAGPVRLLPLFPPGAAAGR